MSVLIKGMDMPTNCADCKVRIAIGCCGNLPHNMRMPNCPLGEVPTPHGRLIDADALGIGKAKREVFNVPEYADGWNSAVELIYNAPTVIESGE